MSASFSEIAVAMAKLIASQHGCELESFSLDGVDTFDDHGTETVRVQVSARITPVHHDDEVPFDLPEKSAAP